MTALSDATLSALPAGIAVPRYPRETVRPGIAHIAVGNFHRAHMAVYVDRCLARAGQQGWGILGIGVMDDARERAKAAACRAQNGLYSLSQYPPQGAAERLVIGSIVDYLHAPDDPAAVVVRLADPAIRIVSMTITEGGYNTDGQGHFRLDAPSVAHDLANPAAPRSAFGIVAAALARRRGNGVAPFTVLSCDNLQHNGAVARRAFTAFARAADPALADWMDREVDFPNCMVDRITPAVTAEDVRRLNAESGLDDAWPLFAEDFIQWVVEDRFRQGRPAWEQVGVQFTDDVAPYEHVKLRMLNASHLMLAYPAALGGLRLVHEAMADRRLFELLHAFMTRDAMPLLPAPPGMALETYRDTVLSRFTNPAIGDQILRLCFDGAGKLPVFIGGTLREMLARGADTRRIAFLLAAFVQQLGGTQDRPSSPELEPNLTAQDFALALSPDPGDGLRLSVFRDWGLDAQPDFVTQFVAMRAAIAGRGALEVAGTLV